MRRYKFHFVEVYNIFDYLSVKRKNFSVKTELIRFRTNYGCCIAHLSSVLKSLTKQTKEEVQDIKEDTKKNK